MNRAHTFAHKQRTSKRPHMSKEEGVPLRKHKALSELSMGHGIDLNSATLAAEAGGWSLKPA